MRDIFSGEKKKNPSSHFLTCTQYTHYLGREAAVLTTVLDKCAFLLLSFVLFCFSVGINFWGLFFFFFQNGLLAFSSIIELLC